MKRPAAPLRFLGLVIGGWVTARTAFLLPAWLADAPSGASAARPETIAPGAPATATIASTDPVSIGSPRQVPLRPVRSGGTAMVQPAPDLPQAQSTALLSPVWSSSPTAPSEPPLLEQARFPSGSPPLPGPAVNQATTLNRWSLTGWALLRQGSGAQLAPGGQLGASQVGARLILDLGGRVGLSARLSAPIDTMDGAEAALGIEWQPVRSLPVRLLAERRQAIGSQARSALALTVHGGIGEARLVGPLRAEAYAQAGVVGLRSRDLFVDGSARIGLPVSERFSLGGGLWGAAQPGAARLDLGPELGLRLPEANLRVSASYRLRVAGDARPGSGPALTLSTDF